MTHKLRLEPGGYAQQPQDYYWHRAPMSQDTDAQIVLLHQVQKPRGEI